MTESSESASKRPKLANWPVEDDETASEAGTETESENEPVQSSSKRESPSAVTTSSEKYWPSPFRLMRIQDLGATENVDTITLSDILSDPLIRVVYNFNFLFSIDFIM